MLILTIRTDKPEAEIGLFNDIIELDYLTWEAHRQLAETLHSKIEELLCRQNKNWLDIEGLVLYQGPGSFTGLRIGASLANALASTLAVPIVAGKDEDSWQQAGIKKMLDGKTERLVMPKYGQPVHITQQKK